MNVFTQKNIKIIFLADFLTNLFMLIINLVNQLLFVEVKMVLIDLLKQFLKSINTVKKQLKNKENLIMTGTKKKIFDQVTHAGYLKN